MLAESNVHVATTIFAFYIIFFSDEVCPWNVSLIRITFQLLILIRIAVMVWCWTSRDEGKRLSQLPSLWAFQLQSFLSVKLPTAFGDEVLNHSDDTSDPPSHTVWKAVCAESEEGSPRSSRKLPALLLHWPWGCKAVLLTFLTPLSWLLSCGSSSLS